MRDASALMAAGAVVRMARGERAIISPSKRGRVIPGFGLSMGVTVTCLSLVVLIPVAGLVFKSAGMDRHLFWQTVTGKLAMDAYRLTFWASAVAASVNGVFGLLVAW